MPVDIISYAWAWARRPETAVATFGKAMKGRKIAAVDNYNGTIHKHMVANGFYLREVGYFGAVAGDIVFVFVYDDKGVLIGSDRSDTLNSVKSIIETALAETLEAPPSPTITVY